MLLGIVGFSFMGAMLMCVMTSARPIYIGLLFPLALGLIGWLLVTLTGAYIMGGAMTLVILPAIAGLIAVGAFPGALLGTWLRKRASPSGE